jgi:hypothetical protein
LGELANHLQVIFGPYAPSKEDFARVNIQGWHQGFGKIWGALTGRRIAVGSTWEDEHGAEVLALRIPVKGRWTFVGRESPARNSRAHLRYEHTSDVVPLGEDAGLVKNWVSSRIPELKDRVWSSASLRRQGELRIDPATLVGEDLSDRTTLTFTTGDSPPVSLRVVDETTRSLLK